MKRILSWIRYPDAKTPISVLHRTIGGEHVKFVCEADSPHLDGAVTLSRVNFQRPRKSYIDGRGRTTYRVTAHDHLVLPELIRFRWVRNPKTGRYQWQCRETLGESTVLLIAEDGAKSREPVGSQFDYRWTLGAYPFVDDKSGFHLVTVRVQVDDEEYSRQVELAVRWREQREELTRSIKQSVGESQARRSVRQRQKQAGGTRVGTGVLR